MVTRSKKNLKNTQTKVTESAENERGQRVARVTETKDVSDTSTYDQRASRARNVESPRRYSSGGGGSSHFIKSQTSANRIMATVWLAGLVYIGFEEVKAGGGMPEPSKFLGWTAMMGILSLASPLISEELAAIFAVGFLIGLFIFRKNPAAAKQDPRLKNLPPGSKLDPKGGVNLPNKNYIDPNGHVHLGGPTGPIVPPN